MKLRAKDWAALAVTAVILVGILYYGVYLPATRIPTGLCASNLQEIHTALGIYKGSAAGCLPPADRWRDVLSSDPISYVRGRETFVCPGLQMTIEQAKEFGRRRDAGVDFATKDRPDGYAFYRPVASLDMDLFTDPAATPTVFDSDLLLPNGADGMESMAFRHHGHKAGVLFADGHVAFVRERPTVPSPLQVSGQEAEQRIKKRQEEEERALKEAMDEAMHAH